jgi:hypothetical protein
MPGLFLVPLLSNKAILDHRRLRKKHSVIPILAKSSGSVEIGRLELLSSYYATCGCTENAFSTKNKCVSCQERKWCSQFLSRKMMRFSFSESENAPPKLSIRGRFASILVKQRYESELSSLTFDGDERLRCPDEWKGCRDIHPGTRICILEPGGEGRLEFEVFVRESNKMAVYIAPFGQDLPEIRIKLLKSRLKENGIPLVENYLNATHLVVSRFVKDLKHLALHLKSTQIDLQRHFDGQNIKCMIPQWIRHLPDEKSSQYHWVGYSRRIRKGGQDPDDMSQRSNLLTYTRNPRRNTLLVEQLLRLSKAYEKASLFEEEQWKALQFHKLAGRLQCLDFEINQDNFSKSIALLRKIPGIGNSVVGVVADIIISGSSRRAKYLENDPARIAIGNLKRVHGIGQVQVSTCIFDVSLIGVSEGIYLILFCSRLSVSTKKDIKP